MFKNIDKSIFLWILEINTKARNRETIEKFLLNLNSSIYSFQIKSLKKKSVLFKTRAIFHDKPKINIIKNFLIKLDHKYSNIKLIKEKFITNNKRNILPPKKIGRFNIIENKDKKNFIIYRDIIIPAGTGFGTGHHPTTEGIIKALNKIFFNKKLRIKNIIDVGCGSGILSIIMSRLWKCKIEALEIDELAIKASVQNAKINMVKNNIDIKKILFHTKLKNNQYDLIVINILAIPIMKMIKDIKLKLNKNGRVLISGILNTQTYMICNKFRNFGIIIDKYYLMENWVIILLKLYIPPKL